MCATTVEVDDAWLILYASDETNAHPVWGRMERETESEPATLSFGNKNR